MHLIHKREHAFTVWWGIIVQLSQDRVHWKYLLLYSPFFQFWSLHSDLLSITNWFSDIVSVTLTFESEGEKYLQLVCNIRALFIQSLYSFFVISLVSSEKCGAITGYTYFRFTTLRKLYIFSLSSCYFCLICLLASL